MKAEITEEIFNAILRKKPIQRRRSHDGVAGTWHDYDYPKEHPQPTFYSVFIDVNHESEFYEFRIRRTKVKTRTYLDSSFGSHVEVCSDLNTEDFDFEETQHRVSSSGHFGGWLGEVEEYEIEL